MWPFLNLATDVRDAYEAAPERAGEIDFADMIVMAGQRIRQGHYKSPYRYILIDEFQDISAALIDLGLAHRLAHRLRRGHPPSNSATRAIAASRSRDPA